VFCFEVDEMMSGSRSDEMMQRAIDECESCRDVCVRAIVHCLHRGGSHAEEAHITALLDCVDMCATSATFMLRDSTFHRRICEVCADICDACAASCEEFPDDDVMRRCAEECRRCAESCRQMAGVLR
jgi:hypothetical protein